MSNNSNSFDTKRRVTGAILGPIVAIFLWFLPIEALSTPAHHLLAIMSLVAIWWITEPVPIPVAVGIALASSLGFMMPVSTPPNAIVYASGYVPITKMIKSGFIIDLIGIFCITIPIVLIIVKAVMGA